LGRFSPAHLDRLGSRRPIHVIRSDKQFFLNVRSSEKPGQDPAAKPDDWLCGLISIVQWALSILSDPKITPNAASGPPASWKLSPACSKQKLPGCLACLHQGIILPPTPPSVPLLLYLIHSPGHHAGSPPSTPSVSSRKSENFSRPPPTRRLFSHVTGCCNKQELRNAAGIPLSSFDGRKRTLS
jgi:hypothetical protein